MAPVVDMAPVVEVSSPELTHTRAITLLTELHQAFKRKTFQKKLDKLASKNSGGGQEKTIRHLDGRKELAFAVQREILAKYGFSVDESGVIAMKVALRGLLSNPEIAEKSKAVRLQLRLPLMKPGAMSEAEDAQPVQSKPASPPAPTLLRSKQRIEQKMRNVSIEVTSPLDQKKMTITVPKPSMQYPTVYEVKAAIVAQLGDGGSVDPSSFQIVISNGMGGYGNRFDTEIVKIDRVLAVGVKISAE